MVNYCFKGLIDGWPCKVIVAWPLMYCSLLGFFGEVFRGIWNGTDVAIKVFLEQDLTAENMEDFCNEISILRYIAIHILFVSNLVFYLNIFWLFPFWIGICFPPPLKPPSKLQTLLTISTPNRKRKPFSALGINIVLFFLI